MHVLLFFLLHSSHLIFYLPINRDQPGKGVFCARRYIGPRVIFQIQHFFNMFLLLRIFNEIFDHGDLTLYDLIESHIDSIVDFLELNENDF